MTITKSLKVFFIFNSVNNFAQIYISVKKATQSTKSEMLKQLNLIGFKQSKLKLDDFEIIPIRKKHGALGVGSFATVKLARCKKTNKYYALKIVKTTSPAIHLSF